MRARIDHRGLYVDLITTEAMLYHVIRAVRATGLVNMTIEQDEERSSAVSIPFPEGSFAAQAIPALLLVVAEVDNRPAGTLLEDFRTSSGFDAKNQPV